MAADAMVECTVEGVAAPIRNALVGGPFGSDLVSRDYVQSGVPVIRGSNMGHGRWVGGEFAFVSIEKANSLSANCATRGDLVFTQRGTLGQVALVPPDGFHRYLISQSQMKLTVDPDKADAMFLYYFFSSAEQQEYIRQNAIQTGVPHTNLGVLRNTRLTLPSLPEQKAIAAVLGAIDDKIELNRRMNARLEAMARALFQSWFVDFDPVRAKLDGRRPTGLDEVTAALFPATFQDSKAGHIPKGWRVMKVGDFINRLPVGQKYEQKTVSPVGAVPVLDQGKSGVIGFHNNQPGVTATLDEPVAVFANHTCYMRLITYSFSAIQNVLPFVGSGVDTFWAYYATEGRLSFSEYKGHWPDFVIQEATVPPRELTDALGRLVKPLVARIWNNDEESRTLATLRDTLMPKLLSGELSVANVERELAL